MEPAFDRWAAGISLWPLGTPDCDRAQPQLLEMGWVGLAVGPCQGKVHQCNGEQASAVWRSGVSRWGMGAPYLWNSHGVCLYFSIE